MLLFYLKYSKYNTIFIININFSLGRKGLEPLIAFAIEFTAQPVIPTNGTFL